MLLTIMILGLVLVGFDGVTDFNSAVHAQRSSSCDRIVASLSECSSSNSFSPFPDDSSAAYEDDDNENSGGENDDSDNRESAEGDKQRGDIESDIPSTIRSAVPFP
jgi:hypothetical protein